MLQKYEQFRATFRIHWTKWTLNRLPDPLFITNITHPLFEASYKKKYQDFFLFFALYLA